MTGLTERALDGALARARPGLAVDVGLLGGATVDRPARIAIASYEFTGVVRNGGIGTACTSLACALAHDGHDVELVFTGWPEDPSDAGFERWREHYAGLGVTLDRLDHSAVSHCDALLYNTAHSLALYELLGERDRERPYDVLHFVESLGHGFYSLAAKRSGVAFQNATTVVGVHSPRRWLAEAHAVPFDHPIELGDEHLERRSVELADVVVAPSAHMLDWLERRGVRLPDRSYVQQYVTDFERAGEGSLAATAPIEELVFFGRLEPRKGLMVFCDALDELAQAPGDRLRRVTFLGKQVPLGEELSGDYLVGRAQRWPWEWTVVDDLDRDDALAYLRQPGRLAVMASLMDNSPNTVYEAIGLGIAFLASRGGGTAELVHPDDYERATYDPGDPELREIDPGDPATTRPRQTGRVLARRLEQALDSRPGPVRFAVDPAVNREIHLAWHRAVAGAGSLPGRNGGAPHESLEETLLLLDPEVEASPELEAVLLAAAAATPGAAFLTSLGSFDVETPEGVVKHVFLPSGGPPAVGLLGACFGAGAVLARRDALERIGMSDGPPVGAKVADLLAHAGLTGERIDVVPEVLYHLPATAAPGGTLSLSRNAFETLAPYHRALPPPVRDVASLTRRLLAEEAALRAQAERAEANAAAASARLATVLGSRSYRLTAPLRRLAMARRRLRRGG